MQTDPTPGPAPRVTSSGIHPAIKKTPQPILASDVLREDLAPIEPARQASRICDAAFASVFLLVGVLLKLHLGVTGSRPDPGALCLAAAAATAATGALPFAYRWRALLGAGIGACMLILGICGLGPLALLVAGHTGTGAGFELGRVVAATVIPAALLFRSHYRAYRRGLLILGGALLLSAPFVLHATVEVFTGLDGYQRMSSALTLIAIVAALFGFMPAPTTVATAWGAELIAGTLAIDIGLRHLYVPLPVEHGSLAFILTAATFLCSTGPISLGLFQILASFYAPDARRIDVHQTPPP